MSQTLQYLTDDRGQRTAVVLPINDYEKLLEDLDDLAVVAERRDEPVILFTTNSLPTLKPPRKALHDPIAQLDKERPSELAAS